METDIHKLFLQLVRQGIGHADVTDIADNVDWVALKALAARQGLKAVVLDGLNMVHGEGVMILDSMPQMMRLEWIGEVLRGESIYKHQQEVAADMAKMFHHNAIRTYILKGNAIAECYPKPEHRVSVDIDCFLLPEKGDFNAWERGNELIETKGFSVNTDFYKNSVFDISGVNVENHQYLTPFRCNEKLRNLEKFFQCLIRSDEENSRFEGTWLYRLPVMVSALFLIEHAYSHFLHEGLTWRMVLDWMLFGKKHKEDIGWEEFEKRIDEFGFRKFYDSFSRLGRYLIGEFQDSGFTSQDKRMLSDIWAALDLHETVRGWKGKVNLAENTWRARWKYRYFTDMNWVQALWIQVKGFLFEKQPALD